MNRMSGWEWRIGTVDEDGVHFPGALRTTKQVSWLFEGWLSRAEIGVRNISRP